VGLRIVTLAFLAGLLAGCASVYNYPGNQPLLAPLTGAVRPDPTAYEDDVLVALSFSGGGSRAAAFSFGILQELERTRAGSRSAKTLMITSGSFLAFPAGRLRRHISD
jgi:NTE family protein